MLWLLKVKRITQHYIYIHLKNNDNFDDNNRATIFDSKYLPY